MVFYHLALAFLSLLFAVSEILALDLFDFTTLSYWEAARLMAAWTDDTAMHCKGAWEGLQMNSARCE